jgi:hypothetical protein
METIKLWARNGEAVRQAIELGELVHLDTASEELTDEFLLFAIHSGLLSQWAEAFPDPRQEPEIGREVIWPAHLAARLGGCTPCAKRAMCGAQRGCWAPWGTVWRPSPLRMACRCAAPPMTNSVAGMWCESSWSRGKHKRT